MQVKLHDGASLTCGPTALAPDGAGAVISIYREGIIVDPPSEASSDVSAAPHARRGFWPTKTLGPQLDALLGRVLAAERAAAGASEAEWGEALRRLADRVVSCSGEACSPGFFPLSEGVAPVCPGCHSRVELRDHTPVLHLYEERSAAHYEPAPHAWIAGTEGRKLYPWHVAKGAERAAWEEERVMAEVEYNDGIWGLRNRGLDELRVIRNGRVDRVVAIGDVVTLHDGLTLLLAPAPHGRAIVVSRFEH